MSGEIIAILAVGVALAGCDPHECSRGCARTCKRRWGRLPRRDRRDARRDRGAARGHHRTGQGQLKDTASKDPNIDKENLCTLLELCWFQFF